MEGTGSDFRMLVDNSRKYAECLRKVSPSHELLEYMSEVSGKRNGKPRNWPDFAKLSERYGSTSMNDIVFSYVSELKSEYERILEDGSSTKKMMAGRNRGKRHMFG